MIIKYPDPILRTVAEPITSFDESLKQLAKQMFDIMYEHKGIGLAAPQIGISRSIIVVNANDKEMVFVNIQPISNGDRKRTLMEGCLSLPGVYVEVERPTKFLFSAQDLDGVTKKFAFEGMTSRVIQHEYDHLIGKLIIDYK